MPDLTPIFLTGLEGAMLVVYLLSSVAVAAIGMGVSMLANWLIGRGRGQEAVAGSLASIRLMTSREGGTLPRVYGRAGIGGEVIWRGGVTETVVTDYIGSGKRRTTRRNTYYSASMAVALCPNVGDSILGVLRVWLDNKQQFELNDTEVSALNGTQANANPGTSAPNYEFGVVGGDQRIAGGARRFKICLGREDQTLGGSGIPDWYGYNWPGYRGVVTLWWDDLDLTPYYNRLPQVMAEVLSADGTITTIFARECELAGISSSDYSTTGFGATYVRGMAVEGVQSAKDVFQRLQPAYPFGVAEVDGNITLLELATTSSATVGAAELAAVQAGIEESPEQAPRFTAEFGQGSELPRRVEITAFDAENPAVRRYQEMSRGYSRQSGLQQGTRQLQLPLSLTPDEARTIAQQAISAAWDEKFTLKVQLPPKYFLYAPGDRLTIPGPDGASSVVMRITGMNFAPRELLEVEGVRVAQILTEGAVAGGGGQIGGSPPDEGGGDTGSEKPIIETVVWVSNTTALLDFDDDKDGLNVAVCPQVIPTEAYKPWNGATLFRNACGSDDLSQVYEPVARFNVAATIGRCKTVLATGTGTLPYNASDLATYVDVELPYGMRPNIVLTHLGTSLADAFTKTTTANLIVVGKETLQYRDAENVTATVYSGNGGIPVYRLSHLKRGIRDTAGMVGTHSNTPVAEPVVFWEKDAVTRVEMNINEQANTWNYKCTSIGQLDTEVLPVTVTYTLDDCTWWFRDNP